MSNNNNSNFERALKESIEFERALEESKKSEELAEERRKNERNQIQRNAEIASAIEGQSNSYVERILVEKSKQNANAEKSKQNANALSDKKRRQIENNATMALKFEGKTNAQIASMLASQSRKNNNVKALAKLIGNTTLKNAKPKSVIHDLPNNISIGDSLTDGNCFYSSIYRSALELNLLNSIQNILPTLNINNEKDFIASLRELVATYSDSHITRTYDYLLNLYNTDRESFDTMVDRSPGIFTSDHIKIIHDNIGGHKSNLNNFLSAFKKNIRTNRKWVCSIEVEITQMLFEFCNITIRIHSTIQQHFPREEGGRHIIHLYNPASVHYRFFSYGPNRGSNLSRGKSRRGSNTSTNRNRGSKLFLPRRSSRLSNPSTTTLRESRSAFRRFLGLPPKHPNKS